jgi:hypothetical protein
MSIGFIDPVVKSINAGADLVSAQLGRSQRSPLLTADNMVNPFPVLRFDAI